MHKLKSLFIIKLFTNKKTETLCLYFLDNLLIINVNKINSKMRYASYLLNNLLFSINFINSLAIAFCSLIRGCPEVVLGSNILQ
jgi:hypothetical protein